uniref:Ankyrin repeat and sterile alpha motif domain containing 1B n=1 Tax=Callorhinchus milii TaxID=7868 RepID=A0A4W3INL3_CALMI
MGKEQELLDAARTGNVAVVEKLLSGKRGLLGSGSSSIPLSSLLSIWRGPNVNCNDTSGYTALHHAALNGHKDVVLKLLQYEASTNVADNKGCFPLHLAAWKGDMDIVKILIHHGPSHSRVNEQNNENETALHCAAQYGHSDVVGVLLEEITDPTIRNNKFETPLDLAALYGRLQVVKMLINAHPNLMSCSNKKHTPLHLAARNGHKAVVEVLLEAGMNVNCQTGKGSALHEAALFGKMDVVRILLEGGIDANIKDSQDWTALDILKEHPSQKSQQITALIQGKIVTMIEPETKKSNQALDIRLSPSLDSFPPEEEDNPYEFLATAVTKKPRSLDISRLSSGRTASAEEEFQDGHIPEQFAGLLHGSSPACEFPEDPYHLANLLQCTNETNKAQKLQTVGDKSILNQEYKQQVIYKTIFHTKVNQNHGETFVSTRTFCNRDHWVSNTEEKHGFEDRASTLGRVRSGGKTLLELQLTRNISKSDSNLITCSPIEEESRGSRYESVANYFKENKQCTGKCLERTPSFTAEWEEVEESGAGEGPDTVGRWLESIGLPQYENHLLANGFDNIQFMGSNVVEDQDLLEIGILNSSHRQRILQAVRGLPRVKVIGYDGNSPTSVADWLDSLELNDYIKTFLANGYTSMDLVKKLWEIELINVLKINLLGHRKRILASLGDRLHDEPPQKPPRTITLRVSCVPALSPSLSQSTYTGGSLDIPSAHLIMQGDARRRLNDSYFEDMPRSKLERQMAQAEWSEPSITLRPPNEATSSTPVQYWQHHPEKLIFQSCDYEAYYLGSMLVKELRGTESTQDACSKMRKSSEQMKKIPTIILSISYKGVKFIDATNKNIITEHEIRNISCAAQDPEDLSTFAYITKDLKSSHHYCHVFSAFDVNLAYEIILTLGQAFEVAYQLALQARKGGHGLPSMQDSLENKIGKPIPKPRASIRKSVNHHTFNNWIHVYSQF